MDNAVVRFGEFTLDTNKRELRRGDDPIDVTVRAYACLLHLIAHRKKGDGGN